MNAVAALPIAGALDALGDWLWPATRELPQEVRARAQRLWLDTVSCAYSGARAREPARWIAAQAAGDAGTVPLPGAAERLATSAATTSFAVAACWDEACEGVAVAHGRPGVPIVAALWPQLAGGRFSWDQVLRATVAGYEVGARLGARLRIRPGMHVDGAWGAFGAAVALVHLHGGGWDQAARAIEACATQLPFSLYLPIRSGAGVRNLYLGHSAWLGLQAAQAVQAGFTTPRGAVDEFAALALAPQPAGDWIAPRGWLLLQSYWKPFAAVRHVHYGAQAALRLREELPEPSKIEAIRLAIYPEALQYCGNRAPTTVLAAQFSLTFGLAAALVYGELSPAEFRPPRFDDPQLRRLEALVEIVPGAEAFPGATRGARLTIRAAGREWRQQQGPVTGDPGHDPTLDQVLRKFGQFTDGDPSMARWSLKLLDAAPQDKARFPGDDA